MYPQSGPSLPQQHISTPPIPTSPPSPLGLLIPGRPVSTAFSWVSPTQLMTTIPNPGTISELAVFLLPGETLPQGSGLTFFWATPPFTDWVALGTSSASAPSGIFRTGWSSTPSVASCPEVRLGVSLESADVVSNLAGATGVGTDKGLAQLLAADLVNCLGSYSQNIPGVGERIVLPPTVLNQWLARIAEKTRQDPNFSFLRKKD